MLALAIVAAGYPLTLAAILAADWACGWPLRRAFDLELDAELRGRE